MRKLLAAAVVLLAAVAVPASPASASTTTNTCTGGLVPAGRSGCRVPTPPNHYAREECLSLHGSVNYGQVLTMLEGYMWEDNCHAFIYIGSDGGQYRDTFNFTSTGGGGTLSITGAATESECIAFRKTSPAQPYGEPTQWVWQAQLCTAGGTSGGGTTSGAGSKSVPPTHAAREECLSLDLDYTTAIAPNEGTLPGGDGYICNFEYIDSSNDGANDYTVIFNSNGSIGNGGLIVIAGAATESECTAFRGPGNPTQWIWQAQLCTP